MLKNEQCSPLSSRQKQGGFALMEVLLATIIMASLIASVAHYLTREAEDQRLRQYASWISAYVNGVAGYMATQGSTAPSTLNRTGTDWLKPTSCGGTFPDDEAQLSCSIPTNFNAPLGLAPPEVSFDYSTSALPVAEIDFGTVTFNGNADPILASRMSLILNQIISGEQGYQHVEVFHAADSTAAELQSANLRARIDNNIASTVYLRLDGSTSMAAPIVSESDNWALIARDNSGNENSSGKDSEASINVNDAYVRSSDVWVSEVYELAEEAYALAARSPQFMSEVTSGTTISKPNCPGSMTPLIYTYPVIFTGGPNPSNTRLLGGIRKTVQNLGSSWRVRMYANYENGGGWREVPNNMGRISVTAKCE